MITKSEQDVLWQQRFTDFYLPAVLFPANQRGNFLSQAFRAWLTERAATGDELAIKQLNGPLDVSDSWRNAERDFGWIEQAKQILTESLDFKIEKQKDYFNQTVCLQFESSMLLSKILLEAIERFSWKGSSDPYHRLKELVTALSLMTSVTARASDLLNNRQVIAQKQSKSEEY
jgi:hypothetical protein